MGIIYLDGCNAYTTPSVPKKIKRHNIMGVNRKDRMLEQKRRLGS